MSCATGVYVDLSVGDIASATVGPVANAFGTAPPKYNTGDVTATLDGGAGSGLANLVVASLVVKTGLITDIASSPYDGTLAKLNSTATSTVNNLNLGLNLLSAISALKITATTLTSTSTAAKVGHGKFTDAVGSSSITDLSITATGVAIAGLDITAATLPNDDLLSASIQNTLGLNIIANYQAPIYLGTTSDIIGIQTAALAITFNSFKLPLLTGGNDLLSGTVFIADSAASVPEPRSWAMMIFGFGLVGALVRRRQIWAGLPALA
jgi:hypothetical protein